MIVDFRNYDGDGPIECDLCVAGAGAAGITLALAFAGRGERVVVLEGGGLEHDPQVQDLYRGQSVGLPYFELDATRLRFFGGSTNHWGGMCAPLDERDFLARPWIPHSGWPITRAAIEPYYLRAHEILELGRFDYDPAELDGAPLVPWAPELVAPRVFRFSDPPVAMGEAHRADLEGAANLTVLLNANLVDIRLADGLRSVAAFEIRSLDGRRARVRARAFVLALGGLENPRMLLNANAQLPAGIGNAHDLVGRFFMEHPGVIAGEAVVSDMDWHEAYRRFLHPQGTEIQHAVAPGDRLQEEAGILGSAVAFGEVQVTRRYSDGYNALYDLKEAVKSGEMPEHLGRDVWRVLRDIDGVARGIWEKLDPTTYLVFECEQAPNPDSRVRLGDQRDALGLRRIVLDWRLSELDKRTLRVFTEALGREFGRLGLGRVRVADWLTADDASWPDHLVGSNHHLGTTRMADDPRHGVVDRDCRVFGCENLYIAGSSVFPTGGFANPTLNIVALTLRLATHLRERLQDAPVQAFDDPVTSTN